MKTIDLICILLIVSELYLIMLKWKKISLKDYFMDLQMRFLVMLISMMTVDSLEKNVNIDATTAGIVIVTYLNKFVQVHGHKFEQKDKDIGEMI